MQSTYIWGWQLKKNNHILFHLFFTTLSHSSVTHKCMSLRSRGHINSLNNQYHQVLLQCNACVCSQRSKSSACPRPLFLLILPPNELSCEYDGPRYPHLSLLWEATEEQWHWMLHRERHTSGTYHILATVLCVGNIEADNGRFFFTA